MFGRDPIEPIRLIWCARPAPAGTVLGMTSQVVYFDSLPQMVATSDLVIEGTVWLIEPGRIVGEGGGRIQFTMVTVSVDRVFFGKRGAANVVLEEYGLERDRPSRVGDHGVYFLHKKRDVPTFHRLVNSQGRFLDDGSGRLVALDRRAAWAKAIESWSLAQLATEVEDAVRAVAQGDVVPAAPKFLRCRNLAEGDVRRRSVTGVTRRRIRAYLRFGLVGVRRICQNMAPVGRSSCLSTAKPCRA
jgi:hypothetical protein